MFKPAVTVTLLVLALASTAFVTCTGCDSEEGKADRVAQAGLEQAEQARARATDADGLTAVQGQFDQLANSPGISTQMKIVLQAKAQELRLDRCMTMSTDLRNQELAIISAINDIEQMGLQVSEAQAGVASLQKFNPAEEIENLKKKETEIQQGGGDSSSGAISLADVNSRITDLNSQIDKNKSQTDQLHTAAMQARQQAEDLARNSEAETGDKAVQDTIQASNLRKTGADNDSQCDILASQLAKLQTQLTSEKDHKASLEAAVATLDAQIAGAQSGWESLQAQIQAHKKNQQAIIGTDSDTPDTVAVGTISSRAAALQKMLADAGTLRDSLKEELGKAIEGFDSASNSASELRRDMQARSQKATDPDAPIWRSSMQTMHPQNYHLEGAQARELLATTVSGEAGINLLLSQMMNGYEITPPAGADGKAAAPVQVIGMTALLNADLTGTPMPQALAAVGQVDPTKLSQMQDDAGKAFRDALDQYSSQSAGGTDSGPDAQSRQKFAWSGHENTNLEWAEYCMLIGKTDDAKKHQADAQSDAASLLSGAAPDMSSSQDQTPAPTPDATATPTPAATDATGATTTPTDTTGNAAAPATPDTTGNATPAATDNSAAPATQPMAQ